MNQGDVYQINFKQPDKSRPAVILTRAEAILKLNAVTVAPISTTIRDIPTNVFLSEEDGMPKICVVTLDNIQPVHKDKIGAYITHLSPQIMREVREAIEFALDFKKL